MSSHEIVWTFDRDMVTSKIVCNAAPDANCRLTGVCDCESWVIERDADGPFHTYEDYDGAITERHEMRPVDYCNIVLTVDESDGAPDCADEGVPAFEIARTPVEFTWNGDWYAWKRATS